MLDEETIADVQGDADALLRGWGLETDEVPDLVRACRQETGRLPSVVAMRDEACTAIVLGRPRIFLRRGLVSGRSRWILGHELAELHYSRVGYRGEDIEARCDALGAALAVPRRAYLAARRHHGTDVKRLARALATTQSIALLREAEAMGSPGALVRDRGVIVRGEPFVWPELTLATKGAGIVRCTITDEARRVGLRAA